MDLTIGGYSNPVAKRHRKLAPDKHKRTSRVFTQAVRTFELFAVLANMSIPFKCMIVLLILARVQPIKSLVFSPLEAITASPNSPTTSGNGGGSSSSPTQNGTINKEISDLFRDLSTFSDSIKTNDQENNTTLNSLRINNSLLDAALANASNFGLANGSQMEVDDNSLIISVITANILIFVIGFCGNSLVILVILRFTRIETVTDIYILNLAFADLMFLFGLIFLIITMFIDHWIFGNLMCKLYMASTSLNQFASSLLLVVMSFDRFLAVCHPIYAQRFRRLRRAKIICFCIWITCLILMTPIFAFAKTNKELTCAIFWPEYGSFNCEIAFTLYSFGIGFAVPLLLIAAFYTCVIRKLRIAANGPISMGSTRRSRSRETTNKRIEHLVIGIICTYTICWLPYWITQLCVSFTTTLDRSPIEGFYPFVLIATCLSYTNSALNPILYAFLSDNFKRRCSDVFRSIYSVKWCQRPQNQDTHSTIATALCDHSEINHNNSSNNSQRPESRQTMMMNESIRLVSSRFSEPHKFGTSTADGLNVGNNRAGVNDGCNDDESRRRGRNRMIGNDKLGNQYDNNNSNNSNNNSNDRSQNASHCPGGGGGMQQYSDCFRLDHQQQYRAPNSSNVNLGMVNSDDKIYELETLNNNDSHDNQTKRKSVAFSIGTIVVQGPNNNGQIVKGDRKILQVTDKKLQQRRQEAV